MYNRKVVLGLGSLCATALVGGLLAACAPSASTTGQGSGSSSARPANLASAPAMGATEQGSARQGSSAPITKAGANIRTDAQRAKVRQGKRAKSKQARAKSAQRSNVTQVKSAQGPDLFRGWQEETSTKRRVQRQ
jgi:hypothetical protein